TQVSHVAPPLLTSSRQHFIAEALLSIRRQDSFLRRVLDWLRVGLLTLRFMPPQTEKLGLIAGNGKFPFLVIDAARAQGYEVVVAAIKEETFPEIESHGAVAVHWLSLGELSKLIEIFQRESRRRAIMAGQ